MRTRKPTSPNLVRFFLASPMLLLLGLVVVIPFGLMVTYAFREYSFAGVGSGPTLEQFSKALDEASTRRIMFKTLGVGLVVAVIVSVLAIIFAYAVTFRMSKRVGIAVLGMVLTAGIASFLVRVYAWGTILGTNGLVNEGFETAGLIDDPLDFLFFGYFSIAVTMIYVYLPIGTLMVYSSMQEIDANTLQASADLGVGRFRTMTRVVIPQARNGIASCFAITLMFSCTDYITPQIVGGTRGQMIGTIIRTKALTTGDYPAAAAITIIFGALLAAVLGTVVVLWRITRTWRRRASQRVDRLGSGRWPRLPSRLARRSVSRPFAFLLAVYLVAPTLVVLLFSFNTANTLGLPFEGFTTTWYPDIIGRQGFGSAAGNSLQIALIAVGLALLVGVPYGFALHSAGSRSRPLLSAATLVPFAIPPILLGISLLVATDGVGFSLGTNVTALAHASIISPIVVLVVQSRLSGTDPKIVQAARDLGSNPLRAFRTVTAPLVLPSVLGASLVGVAISFDEIFMTTFTVGFDTTLPLWLLGQTRLGFDPAINALGVILMGGAVVLIAGAALIVRRSTKPQT